MKQFALPATLILGLLSFTSCGKDLSINVTAQAAAGLSSPFTTNCQTITSPQFSGIISQASPYSSSTFSGPTSNLSYTFSCVDQSGKTTGTTTITTSGTKLTVSSSEGSTEADSYSKLSTVHVSGIFPIVK